MEQVAQRFVSDHDKPASLEYMECSSFDNKDEGESDIELQLAMDVLG